eukprot:Phypoly_transcript_07945.p1 GENE.Phypoly_transcript_07945~~Phypoly_transcript_07945.p1  ORF type:complete len:483 (+),score=118.55 Phypoly_transcript_07945:83-1531(+)
MSTIYITEPPTKGKVLLKTTLGDVDIELWSKEAPKAARNFVQLCLEGYYDNTIFHRVIKNFIAQGGDPTGTGEGGESIYGGPFPDEFHSRLRFNRRGLLAMASSGPCTNQSQFFITLDKTEELQRKHTIFGKVSGETVFNILRLNDYEVDENDRPLFPAKIISTEVLWNPFEDIVPRVLPKKEVSEPVVEEKPKPAKKNVNLLSFGDEEEDAPDFVPTGMKSSHHFPSKMMEEAIQKKKELGLEDDVDSAYLGSSSSKASVEDTKAQLAKPKAKKQKRKYTEEEEEDGEEQKEEEEEEIPGAENMDFGERMRAKILAKRKKYEPEAPAKKPAQKKESDDDSDDDDDDSDGTGPNGLKKEVDEIYRRKESKLFFKKAVQTEASDTLSTAHKRHTGKLSEQSIMDKLNKFKKNLRAEPQGEDDEWKNHSLVFEKEVNRIDPFAREKGDGYAVYDPLKSQKEKQKHSNANFHQRRLAAVKNTEKW